MNTLLLDGRKFPSIPFYKIIASILTMPFFNVDSLLQLDLFLREGFAKHLFNSTHRDMVSSDSTITRAIYKSYKSKPSTFGGLKDLVYELFLSFPNKSILYDSMKLAIIDGTSFSKHLATAVFVPGDIPFLLDLIYMKTKGKELPTAMTLARKFTQRLGKSFFDLIIYDGLLKYNNIIKMCSITVIFP